MSDNLLAIAANTLGYGQDYIDPSLLGFAISFGLDTISDIEAGAGVADVIGLSLGTGFDTYEEIMAAAAQEGSNTVITFDASNNITLTGVLATTLVADDFLFT